jgi:hypothetical protein
MRGTTKPISCPRVSGSNANASTTWTDPLSVVMVVSIARVSAR